MNKLIEVINHQRHDWLNHIQVLLGYLKLQKYDLCEDYMYRVIKEANQDTLVARLAHPSLVSYLLSFNALHKEVVLEVEIPVPFSLLNRPDLGDCILQIVETYRQHAQMNGEPNTLLLTLTYDGEHLRGVADYAGRLDAAGMGQALADIEQNVTALGGRFSIDIHTDEESVIEYVIPFTTEADKSR